MSATRAHKAPSALSTGTVSLGLHCKAVIKPVDFPSVLVIRSDDRSLSCEQGCALSLVWVIWLFSRAHKEFICAQSAISFLIISANVMANNRTIATLLR